MPMYDIMPVEPRLPDRGRIRLGVKRENGAPMDVHFFVLRDAPLLIPHYGEQPTKLLIFLPFDELDRNITGWHEKYAGSVCVCRGDARQVKDRRTQAGRVIRDYQILKPYQEDDGQRYAPGVGTAVHCPGLNHIYDRCGGCQPTTRILFLVRDPHNPMQLIDLDLATYEITTRSFHNQRLVMGQALSYVGMAQRAQRRGLAGIPFVLERRPAKITYDSGSGPKTVVKHLINLFIDWPALLEGKREMYLALDSSREEVPQLESGDLTSEDELPAIEGELVDEDEIREGDPPRDVTPPAVQIVITPPAPVLARPYTPAQFKSQWQAALPGYERKHPGEVNPKRRGALIGKINAFFEIDPDKHRHTFLRWVTGSDSANDLSAGGIELMLDILVDGAAIKEVKQIVLQDAAEKGQLALKL